MLPLDRGASGRVLTALTEGTDPLHDEVRARGWCLSLGDRDPEAAAIAAAIAAPVFARGRRFLSAIGPRNRFEAESPDKLAALITKRPPCCRAASAVEPPSDPRPRHRTGDKPLEPTFSSPRPIAMRVHAEMPVELHRPVVTDWSRANKRGLPMDCFLEGPCFDAAGNLQVTDIPHGRVFRVSPEERWTQLAEYDGEPNGLTPHPDGARLFVADYKQGILSLDLATGRVAPVLARRNSERFKGPNDLVFARNGDLYFTDQGQTGLHDPTGRVYRMRSDGRLDCLLANGPSPNGLALSSDEDALFVAMTRDNAV